MMNKKFDPNGAIPVQSDFLDSSGETMTVEEAKKYINDAKRIVRDKRYLTGDPHSGVVEITGTAKGIPADWIKLSGM